MCLYNVILRYFDVVKFSILMISLKIYLKKWSSAINPDWSISCYNIKDNIITVIILLWVLFCSVCQHCYQYPTMNICHAYSQWSLNKSFKSNKILGFFLWVNKRGIASMSPFTTQTKLILKETNLMRFYQIIPILLNMWSSVEIFILFKML